MYLEVYSRRWGHPDKYHVDRTATGWRIDHLSITGDCDKEGKPYLFENLDHDSIDYPAGLGGYLAFLWDQAEAQKMTDAQIQERLEELGQWIQTVEQHAPQGIWSDYK